MRAIHFPKERFQKSCVLHMNISMSITVTVGDTVEICSEEDGFWGAYFIGKVLAKRGRDKLLVQYKTLLMDKDQNQFLKEIVEARMVRPSPPEIIVSEFKILEKIDAYDNDGWWEGRIVAKKVGSDSYSVYFDTTGDLIDYLSSRLRPHQDYVNGVWIRSLTENHSVFLDMKMIQSFFRFL